MKNQVLIAMFDLAIVGVREGHGQSWSELARGLEAQTSSECYMAYEAVALAGIAKYHYKFVENGDDKSLELKKAIEKL